MTRAIILAAGRGSRMKEHTEEKPKCLNELDGKTMLDWQLMALRAAGISSITVVSGYRAKMLNGDFFVKRNNRWSETNMVASLFCMANDEVDSIISYSDIVYKPEHISKLSKTNGDIVITADLNWQKLWELRFDNPLDDAETFKSKNGILTEIGSKTDNISDIEAQYMGLLKFTPKGWNIMHSIYEGFSKEKQDKMDMTSMLNELLANNVPVHVALIDGGWCEADDWSDIMAYENELNNNNSWIHNWK